jgi:N-acetyl-1-D-myo-inositol-2-amino-2-deoxy-alpha-D-glucopyranoside deacetylase
MALAGHGVRATAPPTLHPRAFSAPQAFAAEVAALVAVLREVRPQVVVSYADDGGYGHPDHVRAHAITVAAVAEVPARLLYAVVGRGTLDEGLAALRDTPFRMPAPDELPSVPDHTITTRLRVRDQHTRRVAAMRAHATQVVVAPDERSFAMSNGVAQPILDVEEYVAVDGRQGTDLFGDGDG